MRDCTLGYSGKAFLISTKERYNTSSFIIHEIPELFQLCRQKKKKEEKDISRKSNAFRLLVKRNSI
jgi:hypothetical protein